MNFNQDDWKKALCKIINEAKLQPANITFQSNPEGAFIKAEVQGEPGFSITIWGPVKEDLIDLIEPRPKPERAEPFMGGDFGCPECYSLNFRIVEHSSGMYQASYQCLSCGFAAPALEWEQRQQKVVERSKNK